MLLLCLKCRRLSSLSYTLTGFTCTTSSSDAQNLVLFSLYRSTHAIRFLSCKLSHSLRVGCFWQAANLLRVVFSTIRPQWHNKNNNCYMLNVYTHTPNEKLVAAWSSIFAAVQQIWPGNAHITLFMHGLMHYISRHTSGESEEGGEIKGKCCIRMVSFCHQSNDEQETILQRFLKQTQRTISKCLHEMLIFPRTSGSYMRVNTVLLSDPKRIRCQRWRHSAAMRERTRHRPASIGPLPVWRQPWTVHHAGELSAAWTTGWGQWRTRVGWGAAR